MSKKLNLTITFRNVGVKKAIEMINYLANYIKKVDIKSAGADVSNFDIHSIKPNSLKV